MADMSSDDALERSARAAYAANIASYAAMTVLPPHLEKEVREPDWDGLAPEVREHWRRIVRAALESADYHR